MGSKRGPVILPRRKRMASPITMQNAMLIRSCIDNHNSYTEFRPLSLSKVSAGFGLSDVVLGTVITSYLVALIRTQGDGLSERPLKFAQVQVPGHGNTVYLSSIIIIRKFMGKSFATLCHMSTTHEYNTDLPKLYLLLGICGGP